MTASTRDARPTDPISLVMRGPVVARVDPVLTLREVAEELAADEVGVVLVEGPHGPAGVLSERWHGGMCASGVCHIPIRDNGEVIGIVSMRDVLEVLLGAIPEPDAP